MGFYEKRKFFRTVFLSMLILLLMGMVFATTVGAANISMKDSLEILLREVPFIGKGIPIEQVTEKFRVIVFSIRLPRIVLSVLIGTGLSVVGASFQGLFKNPMADPYIMGVSSGAALGAAVGITLLTGGFLSVQVMAFIGALLTVLLVFYIAKVGHKVPVLPLILAGVAISAMSSAAISMLMIFHRDQADQIIFWTMGSVASAGWRDISIVGPLNLLSTVLIILHSRELNLMISGEETAYSLGVDVEKVKKRLLVIGSFTIAVVVSVSGVIGFVGLLVPHGVRMIFGGDHRVLLPFSALAGAMFMLLSDTLARTLLAPMEIPVGAITAIFGAPYFIMLLYKSKKNGGFV